MSVYYEILMDLWQNDVNAFLTQAAKLLQTDVLEAEENMRVLDLFVRSLPEEVVARALANTNSNMRA